jgi:hypothetical protein
MSPSQHNKRRPSAPPTSHAGTRHEIRWQCGQCAVPGSSYLRKVCASSGLSIDLQIPTSPCCHLVVRTLGLVDDGQNVLVGACACAKQELARYLCAPIGEEKLCAQRGTGGIRVRQWRRFVQHNSQEKCLVAAG